ncbi:Pentatricopeptide repeat-containing protein [Acorus gramineus]|uniref:Pentatricopeptide repeat-containing protein n=1 Tax=Acorus gramineus TaxID=55184 RepID=A0AAV9BN12_ACOGR|nr:Pentatricopeptide repeat-containing protein [Acorus gramineus]
MQQEPPPTHPHLRRFIALLRRQSNSLSNLKQIHAHSIRLSIPTSDSRLAKHLLFTLLSFPNPPIRYAHSLFSQLTRPDSFTWNTLIRAHSDSPSDPSPALRFHARMRRSSARADTHTYPFVLKACARLRALRYGQAVHAASLRDGLANTLFASNALIHFYASAGLVDAARRVFDAMRVRDLVTWNSIINGLVNNGRHHEAVDIFGGLRFDVGPDGFTMVGLLCACAELGALSMGRAVHALLVESGMLEANTHVGNALMDLYAKCGAIGDMHSVFLEMGCCRLRSVISWNSLIVGLAGNGHAREALEWYGRMETEDGLGPNGVTFVGVLYACSHCGLVDEGFRQFERMQREFSIEPAMEHYGCMVDLLGRAGRVEEAREFIEGMPVEPNEVIWRTLLGACAMHKNVGVAEAAWVRLARIDPGHDGDFVLLSNIYAWAGRWADVQALREEMLGRGIDKWPGKSSSS